MKKQHELKIHHIGYLVKKMHEAIKEFENLGYKVISAPIKDLLRSTYICFLEKDGYTVELISPVNQTSVVSNLIKRYHNSPYHICYNSNNFDDDINYFSNNGYMIVAKPDKATALSDKRVAFLISPIIGLIELLEE